MSVEAPVGLPSPLKHYEVVIAPDPNLHEDGELLSSYVTDRIFPIPEASRIEISPYLPINSPLERAGFLLHQQMVNFINTVSQGKLEEVVEELIIEIRAHANEYTREAPLLVGNVKKTNKGIVNKYNNEPVVNHLDWTEREGATALGSLDLNEKVLGAEDGDSAVLVSPKGWNGKYPDYEKTQIVFTQEKEGKDLDQLTFVLNFSLENCVSLLDRMGVSRADLVCADRRQTIKNVVSQAVELDGETEINKPRNFLQLLKEINPYDFNLKVKVIERDLERHLNGEDISILAPDCEEYLHQLESFLFQNADKLRDFNVQVEYSDRVEETIYKIAAYIRGYGKTPLQARMQPAVSSDIPVVAYQSYPASWRDHYRDVIYVLQQISGCAGGGSRSIKALGGSFLLNLPGSVIEGKFNKDGCSRCGAKFVELECGVCKNCC